MSKEDDLSQVVVRSISIDLLKPSRYQVRDAAFFNKEELENLAASIKSIGLLQRPKVRVLPENPQYFEIISGHRRIRAVSNILGWKKIECEILESDNEFRVFQLCLEDNIQRNNLSPYEEGMAFLISERMFGLSQDQIAERLHQSRATVQSKRQLALLANSYLQYAESAYANAFLRHVTLGHITVLSRLDPNNLKHAIRMISRGVTVRHLERFANLFGSNDFEVAQAKIIQEFYNGSGNHVETITSKKVERLERLLQSIEHLTSESPMLVRSQTKEIERLVQQILAANKVLASNSKGKHAKKIFCPKCGTLLSTG